MKIESMTFIAPCDGKKYKWTAHWDHRGGNLYDANGSSLADLDVDKDSGDWIVTNFDGARDVKNEPRYEHPIIGIFHKSLIRESDALAQAALTLSTFLEHGWKGRRKRGTGPFKGEYS